ncbi:hypothetical protein CLIB1444_01S06898 [[Candida] jaroonii]|uniref:Uncharacterized protein n=1 Tax=[Candida] jaroonii TaxID=467808 RepID=A0ACA9Y0U1_9ASCO|nr:hypothetical protein CLIB1444_01S06898 [[Candida] jaroonii]
MSNTLVQRVSEVKRRRVEIIPHVKLEIVDSVKELVKEVRKVEKDIDEMQVDEVDEVDEVDQIDKMEDIHKSECPCGYLHGPGQGHHDDINAVGLSSQPLLRGPD